MRFEVERVQYMPSDLKPGVLYVSDEFGIAIHLCACGCGSKVHTSLGATEFSVEETPDGPSVFPSISNWQRPCRSHYWIKRGQVVWAEKLTLKQATAGHAREEARRRAYYSGLDRKRGRPWARLRRWVLSIFHRS